MAGINGDAVNTFPINGLGDADAESGEIVWIGADFFRAPNFWSLGILAPEGGEIITVPPRDTSMEVCRRETAMSLPCIERRMSLPIGCRERHMVIPANAEGCSE